MKMAKILLTLVLGALLAGCGASHLAYRPGDSRIKEAKDRAETIPVFLPRTVLEFRCTAVKKTVEPSILFKKASKSQGPNGFTAKQVREEAERLGIKLKDTDAEMTAHKKITFAIKDPALATRGERDPDALFFIRMNSGLLKKIEFNTQLSPDGVPGLISSTVEDKSFEFTMKTVEVAAGIAGKVIGVKMAEIQPEGKTLLAAVVDQIKKVRGAREALISGKALSAQVDEKTFARMLDELDKLEARLVAYFTGASKEESFPVVSTIRPTSSPTFNNNKIEYKLFEFGKDAGFREVASSDVRLSSLPTELQLEPEELAKQPNQTFSTVTLILDKPLCAESRALDEIKLAEAEDRGLPYRIPARIFAEVSVVLGQKSTASLIRGEILLAQWGVVNQLPSSVGSPGSTFKPVYYGETGGLKELTVTGTPLSPDSLSSLEKATGSITEALKAKAEKEKEKASKEDELNVLKREADILEQKVRIQDLQQKLPPSD